MAITRSVLITLTFCMLTFYALAGAWNKEKGSGYTQFSFTYLSYSSLLNGHEDNIDLKRTINDYTFQWYTEYGISKKWNVILNFPYKYVSSGSAINTVKNDPYPEDTLEAGEMHGMSNMSLGIRWNIIDKSYVLSFQLMAMNRMHQYQPNTGLRIGYDAWWVTPTFNFGKGWNAQYLQIEAGFSLNDNKYAQNTIGNIEWGHKLFDGRSYLILRGDWKLPLNEGTFDEGNSVQTGLYRDNSAYVSPGLKIIWGVTDKIFLNFAGYGAVYSVNEGANATLNAGMAYQW